MGSKGDAPVIGYHYRVAYHAGLGRGPLDAFLEFRAADKTAWDGGAQTWHRGGTPLRKRGSGQIVNQVTLPATGALTASGTIFIGAPNLFGGEKDQGGIMGEVDIMFGEADQMPNAYLREVFGEQTVAWRGLATVAFCGGRYGAMNPMPQKPAYKIRKILKGWDGDWGDDPCWYPEKAEIPLLDAYIGMLGGGWEYQVEPFAEPNTVWNDFVVPEEGWLQGGDLPFTTNGMEGGPYWSPTRSNIWLRRRMEIRAVGLTLRIGADNGCVVWVDGIEVGASNPDNEPRPNNQDNPVEFTFHALGTVEVVVKAYAEINAGNEAGNVVDLLFTGGASLGMNPAHALFYVRTDGEKGREPVASINDASLHAAADRLYAEGFGLCWQYDPKQDTPDTWSEHICRIIGGSFTRSLIDGQWYLDLARGDYDIDSLPIIGDDDILEFRELPTTLDRAVNSVSVRYFDPEGKEKIITPAVRALGLIRMFGEIHQTLDFPEVPTAGLALRIAERELRAYVTPTRTFELSTTPRTRGIRNNQYFRLQSPRRGIADMVCIMGEQDSGTLRSGALRRKVTQDVYALPDASYVEVEHGVDTRPPQVALPVAIARVFEAPYIAIVGLMPRAELEALPDDVGYLLSAAADPGQHLDYRVAVATGDDEYFAGGSARWCATALIVEAAGYTATHFTLASAQHMSGAVIGAPVLWGSEICRLDALDMVAGTIELGRGCADTVAQVHAAGERIWIITEVARGPGEYSDGEAVDAKLLTRTATRELPLDAAPVLSLEFGGRQARPYPPAGLTVNGEADPEYLWGELSLSWAHRDRVLQADQLIDQTLASIGPEPGTTYTVRVYLDDLLDDTFEDITADNALVNPAADGLVRIEVEAVRDSLTSWQAQVREFTYSVLAPGARLAESGDFRITEAGDRRIVE